MIASPETRDEMSSALNAHHFEAVSIRRFRGLRSIDLDGLGAFNVILGANDTGKTTVMEAIHLLAGIGNQGLVVGTQNMRRYIVLTQDDLFNMLYNLNVDKRSELAATVPAWRERRELFISASTEDLSEIMNQQDMNRKPTDNKGSVSSTSLSSSEVNRPRVFRYDAELKSELAKDSSSVTCYFFPHEDRNVGYVVHPSPQALSEFAQRNLILSRFFVSGFDYDVDSLSELIVNKKKSGLVEILKSIDGQIQDIEAPGDKIFLDIGLKKMLPINLFGNGIIRAASIVSQCILDKSRMVLIDQIEDGIHYTGMRTLLEAILILSTARGMQVFVTTHSVDVLKCLKNILKEERFAAIRSATKCFVLARDRKENVRSYRYDYDQFAHNIEHGIEIR